MGDALRGSAKGKGCYRRRLQTADQVVPNGAINGQRRPWDSLNALASYSPGCATLRCPLSDERGNGKGERDSPARGQGGQITISPKAKPIKPIFAGLVPPQ